MIILTEKKRLEISLWDTNDIEAPVSIYFDEEEMRVINKMTNDRPIFHKNFASEEDKSIHGEVVYNHNNKKQNVKQGTLYVWRTYDYVH